ncbi:hypothetical protein HY214_02250 [Candidatus Roizmanbacteria bacterium]|nr:hypothetical protein [Candidatus Roizmanbacteria bacterium]
MSLTPDVTRLIKEWTGVTLPPHLVAALQLDRFQNWQQLTAAGVPAAAFAGYTSEASDRRIDSAEATIFIETAPGENGRRLVDAIRLAAAVRDPNDHSYRAVGAWYSPLPKKATAKFHALNVSTKKADFTLNPAAAHKSLSNQYNPDVARFPTDSAHPQYTAGVITERMATLAQPGGIPLRGGGLAAYVAYDPNVDSSRSNTRLKDYLHSLAFNINGIKLNRGFTGDYNFIILGPNLPRGLGDLLPGRGKPPAFHLTLPAYLDAK